MGSTPLLFIQTVLLLILFRYYTLFCNRSTHHQWLRFSLSLSLHFINQISISSTFLRSFIHSCRSRSKRTRPTIKTKNKKTTKPKTTTTTRRKMRQSQQQSFWKSTCIATVALPKSSNAFAVSKVFFFVSSILTKINQYFFINCFIGYILFNFIYWIIFLFWF